MGLKEAKRKKKTISEILREQLLHKKKGPRRRKTVSKKGEREEKTSYTLGKRKKKVGVASKRRGGMG